MHKKKEEKESASVMFQKIANAYEVSTVMMKVMTWCWCAEHSSVYAFRVVPLLKKYKKEKKE